MSIPQAWLADVLDKIANRHPMSKIDELLPWAYINNGAKRQAAENTAYYKPRGVPRSDDRKVLNGIYWRLRTGSPWAEIPERYGPSTTCYNRFVRWARIGVGIGISSDLKSLRWRFADDRQFLDPRPPAWRQRQKGGVGRNVIRRSGPRWEPAAWGAREAD